MHFPSNFKPTLHLPPFALPVRYLLHSTETLGLTSPAPLALPLCWPLHSTESLGLGVDELRPVWRAPHAAVTVADGTGQSHKVGVTLLIWTIMSTS